MENRSIILWLFGTSLKKWDTKLGVAHKHDVLSVYCWHVIFFDLFFIKLMFVYLQILLQYFILYITSRQISCFHCVDEICNQSDLAILSKLLIILYARSCLYTGSDPCQSVSHHRSPSVQFLCILIPLKIFNRI